MAQVTKAELEAQLAVAKAELQEARASVKAWYQANPIALLLVAAIGFAAGAFIF